MCASYGLGGGPYPDVDGLDISPLDERVAADRVTAWMDGQHHTARITGSRARNLNPIIVAAQGGRSVELAWWWLHVRGEPAKFSAFNATSERLLTSWRFGMRRRALAPATWYVEKGRSFGLGGAAFGMAAITTAVRQDDGSELLTYAIVTRPAVGAAAEIHPRMPLVLPRDAHDEWLDPATEASPELVGAMVGASEEISRELTLVG